MDNMPDEHNGEWMQWRRYILNTLLDIRKEQSDLRREQSIQAEYVQKIRTDLAVLKVKAGMWGSFVGVATAATVIAIDYFLKH